MSQNNNANFKSPARLIVRMLKSGNKAARRALLHESLRYALSPLDWIFSVREARILKSPIQHEPLPLILIVGPPRGGTTLVYQVLARAFDVAYPSNLSAIFPRSPIYATRLFERLVRSGSGDFQSFYGKTAELGGPNDGFHIWNRWLGPNRHISSTNITEAEVRDMQRFFHAWTSTFAKPFLNKNNRNTHCIGFLAEHLPAAFFVVVNRNPIEIARSLIRARAEIQGNKKARWGLQSQETHSDEEFGYVRDVCEQIIRINAAIHEQVSAIDPHRVAHVDYHSLCENPMGVIAEIEGLAPTLRRSAEAGELPPSLTSSESVPLSATEESLMLELLDTYSPAHPPHLASREGEPTRF